MANKISIKEASNLLMASEQYVLDKVKFRGLKAWVVHGELMLDRDEVVAFRWDYDSDRRKVLDEMVALNQEMGLYPAVGSTLDSLLEEDGILDDCRNTAIGRVKEMGRG